MLLVRSCPVDAGPSWNIGCFVYVLSPGHVFLVWLYINSLGVLVQAISFHDSHSNGMLDKVITSGGKSHVIKAVKTMNM